MQKSLVLSPRRRWLLAVGFLGSSALLIPCQGLRAQAVTAPASAGADPTASTFYASTTYFDIEGPGNTTHAEFGVLDFSTSVLNASGQTASSIQNNQLTLQLTESNAAFTAPSTLEFYLSTATGVSIATGSSLRYQTAMDTSTGPTPYGIDPLLGSIGGSGSTALYDLGSGTTTSTGSTGVATVDTYTLTLGNSAAVSAFLTELNTANSTVRLVMAVTTAMPGGAATFVGVGNNTATSRPMLSFVPAYSVSNAKYWQGGNGGSWTPTSTNFGSSATTTGTSWDNGGTATAVFSNAANTVNITGGNINAAGLEFDVTGYTVNGTGTGNTLTLTGNSLLHVVNATSTATINAPIVGAAGLTKIGAGTLVLGGTNTYTGTTTITAGTLQVSADTALGAASNPLALGGGTLQSTLTSGTFSTARAITGSGGLGINAGATLSVSGVVNAGAVTLPGGGTFVLTNTSNSLAGGAANAFTGLTFQTAGASLQAPNANQNPAFGTINLGTGGITASQTSGTVTASGIFQATGATVPMAVTNAAATLTLNGILNGPAVLVKTGTGTLVINSDNSGLTGSGTTTVVSFRQGTAGAANGGVVSIGSGATANPNFALGTGEFQANGGTVSNDSGGAVTLASSDISLGAAVSNPLVFAGANAITVTGPISLYKGATNAYQHGITVNTPTTFSGIFTASTTTTTSLGVVIAGSSTLTLNGTAPNTFFEPVTIATSGTGAGVIAGKDGAFGANTSITLNAGAQLTINTGVTSGTANAINDAALISINGTSGSPSSFGRIVLSIGTATETVGGLYLAVGDGKFAAGYLPAGLYGSTSSGAPLQNQDNNLFSGTGDIMNLGTAVPEPSTWVAVLAGGCGLAAMGWRGRRRA